MNLYPEIELLDTRSINKLYLINGETTGYLRLSDHKSAYTLVDQDNILPTTEIYYIKGKYYSRGIDLNGLGRFTYVDPVLPRINVVNPEKYQRMLESHKIYSPLDDLGSDRMLMVINSKLSSIPRIIYDIDPINTTVLDIMTMMGGRYLVKSTPEELSILKIRGCYHSRSDMVVYLSNITRIIMNYVDDKIGTRTREF